jgi:tRNA(Ile2) C34 agmatinyltransferase TiaS
MAMQIYIGFDDTDSKESPIGTGKLARWLNTELPVGCCCKGVIRQQLLVCPEIPYTSHNSSACFLAEIADPALMPIVIEKAIDHLSRYAVAGSDPGLCVVAETEPCMSDLMDFGNSCTHTVMSQAQAIRAAGSAHLSGHGGRRDGIIGAAAAVGLTAAGWLGRYIEYDGLRDYPRMISVSELNARHIAVISVGRDATAPAPQDMVLTNEWLRPRRIAHEPVLLVRLMEAGLWQNIYSKNKKKSNPSGQQP